MTDVTRENFRHLLPQINDSIKNCSFVAFDSEFSALTADPSCVSSLFDSGVERYKKVKKSAQDSIIIQAGLSIFMQDSVSLAYEAETYNFYLCPRSCGALDQRFLVQASSLEFLSNHGFSFDKVFASGISFLNKSQVGVLKEQLTSGSLLKATERNLSHEEEDKIKEICLQISNEKSLDMDMISALNLSPGAKFVLHEELKARFSNLSSYTFLQSKVSNEF